MFIGRKRRLEEADHSVGTSQNLTILNSKQCFAVCSNLQPLDRLSVGRVVVEVTGVRMCSSKARKRTVHSLVADSFSFNIGCSKAGCDSASVDVPGRKGESDSEGHYLSSAHDAGADRRGEEAQVTLWLLVTSPQRPLLIKTAINIRRKTRSPAAEIATSSPGGEVTMDSKVALSKQLIVFIRCLLRTRRCRRRLRESLRCLWPAAVNQRSSRRFLPGAPRFPFRSVARQLRRD